jgi:hypothetical protein
MTDTQDMVIGKDEAVYLYDPTGRGPCFAYDTPKSSLVWFKSHYLMIISPPVITSTQLSTTTSRTSIGAGSSSSSSNKNNRGTTHDLTKVTIFDTANKFVAYVGTFTGGIRGVFCEWNALWVVGLDGKVCKCTEIHKGLPYGI